MTARNIRKNRTVKIELEITPKMIEAYLAFHDYEFSYYENVQEIIEEIKETIFMFGIAQVENWLDLLEKLS